MKGLRIASELLPFLVSFVFLNLACWLPEYKEANVGFAIVYMLVAMGTELRHAIEDNACECVHDEDEEEE